MAVLQFKRGTKSRLPATAAAGEPVWSSDTRELFVGTGTGLVPVLPAGIILMWSGVLSNVPVGWALCDGANGTPDLRDKFVKGWAAGVDPGTTGGSPSATYTPAGTCSGAAVSAHSGTAVSDHASHTHTTASSTNSPKLVTSNTSSGVSLVTGGPSATLTHTVTQPANHTVTQPTFAGTQATIPTEPAYFKLAFIMKL